MSVWRGVRAAISKRRADVKSTRSMNAPRSEKTRIEADGVLWCDSVKNIILDLIILHVCVLFVAGTKKSISTTTFGLICIWNESYPRVRVLIIIFFSNYHWNVTRLNRYFDRTGIKQCLLRYRLVHLHTCMEMFSDSVRGTLRFRVLYKLRETSSRVAAITIISVRKNYEQYGPCGLDGGPYSKSKEKLYF